MLVMMLVDGHTGVMHDDQGQGDSSYLTTTMSMIINMVNVTMIVMLVMMVSFMVTVDHGNVEITKNCNPYLPPCQYGDDDDSDMTLIMVVSMVTVMEM